MTDFSKTLIRCSAIGSIMSDAKGTKFTDKDGEELAKLRVKHKEKNLTALQAKKMAELMTKLNSGPELSETCKGYLIRTYALEKYKRMKEEPITKHMTK